MDIYLIPLDRELSLKCLSSYLVYHSLPTSSVSNFSRSFGTSLKCTIMILISKSLSHLSHLLSLWNYGCLKFIVFFIKQLIFMVVIWDYYYSIAITSEEPISPRVFNKSLFEGLLVNIFYFNLNFDGRSYSLFRLVYNSYTMTTCLTYWNPIFDFT